MDALQDAEATEPSRPWTQHHRDTLAAGARALGVDLDAFQLEQFEVCYREMVVWNHRMNLTSIIEPDEVVDRHFLDSLSCLLAFPGDLPEHPSVIDIGAGAGFPGIPLKIARPELQLTLLDSVGKKTSFMEHLVKALALEGATIVTGRAEELGRDPRYREQFHIALCRAVAEMAVLVEYSLPFLVPGGRLIAPKKTGIQAEIQAAEGAIRKTGGELVPPIVLADPTRQLVLVDKLRPTPPEFPRRPGLPARRPLR